MHRPPPPPPTARPPHHPLTHLLTTAGPGQQKGKKPQQKGIKVKRGMKTPPRKLLAKREARLAQPKQPKKPSGEDDDFEDMILEDVPEDGMAEEAGATDTEAAAAAAAKKKAKRKKVRCAGQDVGRSVRTRAQCSGAGTIFPTILNVIAQQCLRQRMVADQIWARYFAWAGCTGLPGHSGNGPVDCIEVVGKCLVKRASIASEVCGRDGWADLG